MIVPMKKVSLITAGDKKSDTLKKLRKLGIMHIEASQGSGEKLSELKSTAELFEKAIYIAGERLSKDAEQKDADVQKALSRAEKILRLVEEKKTLEAELSATLAELERLKAWGEIDLEELELLSQKGIALTLYEMPPSVYNKLDENIKTLCLSKQKQSVKFAVIGEYEEQLFSPFSSYKLSLPDKSTDKIKRLAEKQTERIQKVQDELCSLSLYLDAMKKALISLNKQIEFETNLCSMAEEKLSDSENSPFSIAYFTGFTEAENAELIKSAASKNSWGLILSDPTEEDNAPTKLKNNKLVSLIYPLTDFLGTVPGYFEYDISAWFLTFILIFFGIIFGDGGYGLLICAVAAIPIIKSLISKKEVPPAFLLVGLFGLSTVVWGTITCTWFGLSPQVLPSWLKSLSIPVISNVYADKIWHPFWADAGVGLTTSQNLQIVCFTLALVQLSVAHIKGALRNRGSLKMLGDIGAALELVGIYYIVLMLVVNGAVFTLDLNLAGIPVGICAVSLIGIGFIMNFVFSNYEGSVIKSVVASLKDIVSVLLGVVNVFSDIVSYIRLWAVGLAGAAISATVNELVGPMLGNFLFIIFAIILLVFGHGLNMILNVLSVIVHGIRLNTLEFSSHLNMSWSGRKYEPFKE